MRRYDSLILQREQILATAARYGARNVRVFGSVVRGKDGPESDVDLLQNGSLVLYDVSSSHSKAAPARWRDSVTTATARGDCRSSSTAC